MLSIAALGGHGELNQALLIEALSGLVDGLPLVAAAIYRWLDDSRMYHCVEAAPRRDAVGQLIAFDQCPLLDRALLGGQYETVDPLPALYALDSAAASHRALLLPGEAKPFGVLTLALAADAEIDDGDLHFLSAVVNLLESRITAHSRREALERGQRELEARIAERTRDLSLANQRLEQEVLEKEQARTQLEQRERYLNDLLANSSDLISLIDGEGRLLFHSAASERVLGYALADVLHMKVQRMVHPEDYPHVRQRISEVASEADAERSFIYRYRRADGQYLWVESIGRNRLHDPAVRAIIVNTRDVTAERISERALRRLTEATADATGREFFRRLAQGLRAEIGGHAVVIAEASSGDVPRLLTAQPHELPVPLAVQREWLDNPFWQGQITLPPTSTVQPAVAVAIGDRQGSVRGYLAIIGPTQLRVGDALKALLDTFATRVRSEIERTRNEQRLYRSAYFDALTELPNRISFVDQIERALRRRRDQPNFRFAVLYVDLDRFKLINDSLGHRRGDDLLLKAATRLRALLAAGDTVARISGDEFGVLLEDLRKPDDVQVVADRIVQRFHQPFELGELEVNSTVSVGVVQVTDRYESAEDVLRDADNAMYRSKQMGRSRWTLFDPDMHQQVVAQLRIESELSRALRQEELVLYIQPIVDLRSLKVVSAEVLLRWRHPERGLLLPGEFLPAAEDSGRIVALDRYVFDEACRLQSDWRHRGHHCIPLAVNISARQLGFDDLHEQLAQSCERFEIAPGTLSLELTEGALLLEDAQVRRGLEQIRSLGLRLALDDFGVGYSSLSRLAALPIDTLKLDRAFIAPLESDESPAIVAAMVVLASALGKTVIAEGIESERQRAKLLELGCTLGQGFLFARPLPVRDFESLLAAQA